MKIIPTPQYSEYRLCFGKPLAENTGKVYIEPDLKQKCKPALAFLNGFTECDEDSATLIITDKESTASRFVNIDTEWFLNKNACEQGYIINGTADSKTANELIKTAKENADLSFKTVDALGGALSRRQEIFETLKYNLELMCDSIKTDKRIPDSAKKLQDENWW